MAAPRLALSVFVLMLAVITLSEGLRGVGPKRCCFRFREKEVSEDKVIGYTRTSQRCPKAAILLKTVEGKTTHQLCANPSTPWVENLISKLDKKPISGRTSNL